MTHADLVCVTLQALAEGCQKEAATKLMLSTVVGLGSDAVPNVKFNVAKTLMRIGQWLDSQSIQTQVKPVLEKLKQDSDADVSYFAIEAMEGRLIPSHFSFSPNTFIPYHQKKIIGLCHCLITRQFHSCIDYIKRSLLL